jgi:WD40 repeat protein
MKVIVSTILIIIFSGNIALSQKPIEKDFDYSELKGNYFGQKPPGITPELFAPDIFHKIKPEWVFCTEFTPDLKEFYFTEYDTISNIDRIMYMLCVDDIWTKPKVASFSGNYNDNDQRLAPDGNIIFWRSRRPLPGNSEPEKYSIIWFAHRTEKGWDKSQPVKYDNTYLEAGYPSISNNGILYFSAYGENNIGKSDIHSSKLVNGNYDTPKNIGSSINTKYAEGDLYISPDESFIIVSCWNRPDNSGESDLYISFRNLNGTWTKLKNMEEPINTKHNENCPSFSPDGKYFFYNSVEVDGKIPEIKTYWVDGKIIENLKPKQ